MNKVDMVDDKELIEARRNGGARAALLQFPGDDIPVIKGSALCALEGKNPEIGKESVLELMKAVDDYIRSRIARSTSRSDADRGRVLDLGPGTVVTGHHRARRHQGRRGVEIVGIRDAVKSTVTGVEMFRKLLDQGQAGDNVGCLLRGIDREGMGRARSCASRARSSRTRSSRPRPTS